MTDDIVPHLLEQLQSNIESNQETSTKLRQLLLKLRAKKADYIDAHAFAVEAGEIAAQAFKEVITPDVLPDGRMYYNIGNRLLPTILGERHDLISSYAAKVQTDLNEKAGIHLKTQVPELNMNRIKGLVDRLDREEHFEDVAWILDSPVVGFCMNVVDTTIDKNIKFQYQAGLHPKLTRSLEDGKACKWCRNLAGTYRYPDEVPDMVYHRHNNCRCTTYFYPGDGKRQDVWSKKVEQTKERQNQFINEYEKSKITKESNKIARRTIESMRKVEPGITNDLKNISEILGSNMMGLEYRLKSTESLARKIETDSIKKDVSLEESVKQIHDVLRYTAVKNESEFTDHYFDFVENMNQRGYNLIRVKNTFVPNVAYKGVNTLVQKDDVIFELQFHTPKSVAIKENELHNLYEQQRILDKEKNRTEYARLEKAMVDISATIPNPPGVERIK